MRILSQGRYEKSGQKIMLKPSTEGMKEIQVYLPDAAVHTGMMQVWFPICSAKL